MTAILAIDTSSQLCTVALTVDGVATAQSKSLPREHTQHLLPMVDHLLATHSFGLNKLDAIAVAIGPGSFTGVRVGVSFAQGLAFALGIPVVTISTLEVLARRAARQARFSNGQGILSAIDARRQEVYVGLYHLENGLPALMAAEFIAPVSAVEHKLLAVTDEVIAVGSGAILENFHVPSVKFTVVTVEGDDYTSLLALALESYHRGDVHLPENVLPQYLRNKVTD